MGQDSKTPVDQPQSGDPGQQTGGTRQSEEEVKKGTGEGGPKEETGEGGPKRETGKDFSGIPEQFIHTDDKGQKTVDAKAIAKSYEEMRSYANRVSDQNKLIRELMNRNKEQGKGTENAAEQKAEQEPIDPFQNPIEWEKSLTQKLSGSLSKRLSPIEKGLLNLMGETVTAKQEKEYNNNQLYKRIWPSFQDMNDELGTAIEYYEIDKLYPNNFEKQRQAALSRILASKTEDIMNFGRQSALDELNTKRNDMANQNAANTTYSPSGDKPDILPEVAAMGKRLGFSQEQIESMNKRYLRNLEAQKKEAPK